MLPPSILTLSTISLAEVYLKETFTDAEWEKRWIQSKHQDNLGNFTVSSGKFYADEIESRGLKTSQNEKFYAISSKFDKTIDNSDKNLVVQFSVKHEQGIDCGGGYVKLLPPDFDALDFKGESPYNIMFGPDICGGTRKVHVILNYDNENKQIKKQINAPSDQLTHLYTFILKPDQTYEVLIDDKEEASGKLEEDFDLIPPKDIIDPDAKKPEDWVDEAKIPDPDDKKPDDWKDVPPTIPDPEAEKPNDWDDDMDGEWEPPHIPNPEYQGEWKPKMIDNPNYKGPWNAPLIPNPAYKEDKLLHAYKTSYIGFDLWQVKSGTIFDNILITDDIEEAKKFSNETFIKYRDAELEAKRKLDELETKETTSKKIQPDGQVQVTTPDPANDLPQEPKIVQDTQKQIPIQEEKSTKDENDKLSDDKKQNEELEAEKESDDKKPTRDEL
ncbi:3562_t:CDS:10 [Funneliformis geosporum]|uniref:Calreticulin n=1 Tax=Funneliformis geosporum TaxID=1117311 RepID=A0A9W4WTW5_9GLOM|nr:3562_t:CDS:10 [Funneliformis geosporum]